VTVPCWAQGHSCLGGLAVVDEPYFEVTVTCASASKWPLACGYTSQKFSAIRAVFGPLLPWMCPELTSYAARPLSSGAVHESVHEAGLVTPGWALPGSA
jgi:hypothetical protein